MNQEKKTIFLTIDDGTIARNLLLNDFFQKLKENYRVVIFTSQINDERFRSQFGEDGVVIEELIYKPPTRLEIFFIGVHKALIYNPSVRIKSFYGLSSRHKNTATVMKIFNNYFELVFFGLFLSKLVFLRDLWKKLDALLFQSDFYEAQFDRYRPAAVFIANVASSNEIYLLREAKKRGIVNFGMTRSWDNFSKIGIREKVDYIIVWSDYMKSEVLEFQRYREKDIFVAGIPQFDIYEQIKNQFTKDDFAAIYGLNPRKKIILFGPISGDFSPDDPYIVEVIRKWITRNNKNCQILIRPHLKHRDSDKVFDYLVDNKTIFIDKIVSPSNFRDLWDFSPEHHRRLALSVRFSDVVITSVSTLVLDGLASDNQVICYGFDKDKNKSYKDSICRLFETLWFVALMKFGLDRFVVKDEAELRDRLEEILYNPDYQRFSEAESIIKRFCYRSDGKTGERIFDYVNNKIN